MIKFGTFITNRLRESGKTASDIANDFKVRPSYIYRIIHGQNTSWAPKAMKIRLAIANQLHAKPEHLWLRPQKNTSRKKTSQ